jgi:ribonuclease HII
MSLLLTIPQIKEKLDKQLFTAEEWDMLQKDERKGVQKLISQYEKKIKEKEKLKDKFAYMLQFEREQWKKGIQIVAGIDEAGRGPLAGPVVAAAVVIDEHFYIEGLNDSKQLSEKKREYFYEKIKEDSLSYGIGIVDNQMIDKINILQATKLAMKKAITQLSVQPNYLLIDAVHLTDIPISQQAIVKGDQRSVSIAAASVLAKVTRDRIMKQLDEEYPVYQFARNMGYGTKEHLLALQKYGPCPYHRLTFAKVK